MLHILIYYLRRLDEDTKIEWKWILLVNVTEALVCMCPRGFFSRHEHKGKLSSVLYIVGNALWLCTRENILAIVVKLCHFYWYGCHLYAIHNFVWGISCIVSLSFSTLRARKAVSFFKDCCGLIHCDSSCSTECCVSGKLCAHIYICGMQITKRKRNFCIPNAVALVFLDNSFIGSKSAYWSVSYFVGNVYYF